MMMLLAQGDPSPTFNSDAVVAWGVIIATVVVVGYVMSKLKRPSTHASTGDSDVDAVLQKVLPDFRCYRPFFRSGYSPSSEAELQKAIVDWVRGLRRSNMAITEKLRCEMADTYLEMIWDAGNQKYKEWVAKLVPKYLVQLERAVPDVHEVYAKELGLTPPDERHQYACSQDEERDQWMAGPQKYPVALDLYIGLQNLREFTEKDIERRFGEIVANYQRMKQRHTDGDPEKRLAKLGKEYLKVAQSIYEDSKRLSFFWSAQTRPDRGQDFKDRITACVAEAMLAGRDIKAPGFDREVLHNVNLQFLNEENCRFKFGFAGWTVWPTIVASVARAVPEAFRESDVSDEPLTGDLLAVEASRWACERLPELLNYPTWGQAVFDFTKVAPPELVQHLVAFASTFAQDRKQKRFARQAAADAVRAASVPPVAEPAPSRNIAAAERARIPLPESQAANPIYGAVIRKSFYRRLTTRVGFQTVPEIAEYRRRLAEAFESALRLLGREPRLLDAPPPQLSEDTNLTI